MFRSPSGPQGRRPARGARGSVPVPAVALPACGVLRVSALHKARCEQHESRKRVHRLLGHDGAHLRVFMAESRYLDIYGEYVLLVPNPWFYCQKKQTRAPKLVFKWKCAQKRMISPSNQFY